MMKEILILIASLLFLGGGIAAFIYETIALGIILVLIGVVMLMGSLYSMVN